jgi:alpha-tubulin suppressor-like RCC1 family protein
MINSTRNRITIGRVLALDLLLVTLLVTLLATLLSPAPAGAVVSSGKAFTWGDNYFGRLGNGTSGADTGTNIPAAVKNLSGVKSVKAGCSHGLALNENGYVRAWGYNREGELGNGTINSSNAPVAVYIENVKAISAGCSHSLALKENGTVWAWGDNTYGQLGQGYTGGYSHYPMRVASLGTGVRAIAAGEDFNLALMNNGTVRSWGRNYKGELGNGTETTRSTPGPSATSRTSKR